MVYMNIIQNEQFACCIYIHMTGRQNDWMDPTGLVDRTWAEPPGRPGFPVAQTLYSRYFYLNPHLHGSSV